MKEFLSQTGFQRQYGREQIINTTKNVGVSVDIFEENGRIKSTTDRNGASILQTAQTIGKIDIQKYKCVTPEIMTDEVIITDERIGHIKNDIQMTTKDFALIYHRSLKIRITSSKPISPILRSY